MLARLGLFLVASCAFQSIFAAHSGSHQVPLARTNAEALARGDRVLAPSSFVTSTDAHGRTRTLPRRSKIGQSQSRFDITVRDSLTSPSYDSETSADFRCCLWPDSVNRVFVLQNRFLPDIAFLHSDVRFHIAVRGTNGADVGFVSNGPEYVKSFVPSNFRSRISFASGGFVVAQDISQAIVVQVIAGISGLPSVVFSLSAADGNFALMGSTSSTISSDNIGQGTTGHTSLIYSAFGTADRLGSANVLGGRSQAAIWVYSCVAGIKSINAVVLNAQGTTVQTTIFYSLVDGVNEYPFVLARDLLIRILLFSFSDSLGTTRYTREQSQPTLPLPSCVFSSSFSNRFLTHSRRSSLSSLSRTCRAPRLTPVDWRL